MSKGFATKNSTPQKSKKRVVCVTDLINTQIDIIKKTCQELQLKYDDSCLNFLDQRDYSNTKIPFNKYIQLHFDEKWIHNKYISKSLIYISNDSLNVYNIIHMSLYLFIEEPQPATSTY